MTDETNQNSELSPAQQIQSALSTAQATATAVEQAPTIPVAASDIAGDVVDAASLAAGTIADAAGLTDPVTMANAIVDLARRLEAAEALLAKVHTQLVGSGLIARVQDFFNQHFRN
jgi:hypothetical protein